MFPEIRKKIFIVDLVKTGKQWHATKSDQFDKVRLSVFVTLKT